MSAVDILVLNNEVMLSTIFPQSSDCSHSTVTLPLGGLLEGVQSEERGNGAAKQAKHEIVHVFFFFFKF